MKKITLLAWILFFIWVLPVQAQENSLLWKISGNGLSSPSYVFGTMHILCDGAITNKTALQEAFTASNKLVLELNPTDPGVLQELQQLAMNDGFENIYKDLPKEDYSLLDEHLKTKFGAGLDQMGVLKPFTLTSMVIMGFLPCAQPFSPESYFVSEASEDKKEIVALETAKFQVSLFDEIPNDVQIQEIIRSLKDNTGKIELEQMMKIYLTGDLAGLFGYMKSNTLMVDHQAQLLDKRNLAWIPQLETLFKSGSTFVAVGAGHLAGEKGVLSLLKEKGFKVEVIAL